MPKFKFPPELGGGTHESVPSITLDPIPRVYTFEINGELFNLPASILTEISPSIPEPTEPGFYLIEPFHVVLERRDRGDEQTYCWWWSARGTYVTWKEVSAPWPANSVVWRLTRTPTQGNMGKLVEMVEDLKIRLIVDSGPLHRSPAVSTDTKDTISRTIYALNRWLKEVESK